MHPARLDQRGVTLVELIMVIVILGVVAAGMATAFRSSIDMARTEVALGDESSEARRLVGTLTQEIRMANGGTGFTTWTARDCGFNTVRSDSVRFTWSGTPGAPLLAKYNTVTDTISRDVDSLAFAYLDTVRNATATAASIRNVSVYVRLNRGGAPVAQRILVRVRN
jgi:prepilin-type N-terminal cleavage/methylation domain-containing protein